MEVDNDKTFPFFSPTQGGERGFNWGVPRSTMVSVSVVDIGGGACEVGDIEIM